MPRSEQDSYWLEDVLILFGFNIIFCPISVKKKKNLVF